MFVERLLGDARMEHQAEDVEVGVLVRQRLPHQLVAGDFQYLVVEHGILPGELRIAHALVRPAAARHDAGGGGQLGERGIGHRGRRAAGHFRLQQQAQIIELLEAPTGDLRRCAVADEMRLDDQPLALKPPQRLADRRLRYGQLAHQIVDGDARARRDPQRHEAREDRLVNLLGEARGAMDSRRRFAGLRQIV